MATEVDLLRRWALSDNLAEELTDEELGKLGQRVVQEFELDKDSRAEWEKTNEEAMKLARQVSEAVSDPWENAANVKYPLMTVSAIQFASRSYPEIVKGNDVLKCRVTGEDLDGQKEARAKRIGTHMSWQLLEQMEDWETDMDKLLHVLPIMGCAFKKTYRDKNRRRNVSELVLPEDFVVNNRAKTLESARRGTQRFWAHNNDIWERQAKGLWIKHDFGQAFDLENPNDEDAAHEFLEQHRWYDLDGDGYQEPYIVTVHRETGKVVRVVARFQPEGVEEGRKGKVARIDPEYYFTMFPFIPEVSGDFYPLGFGQLLGSLNGSINTIINQLLDAGTLANLGGGFLGRGLRIKGGAMRFQPGEWKFVEAAGNSIRDNVFPLPVPGPSPVLFQLLGFIVEASRDVSSIKDVLTGDAAAVGPNTPVHTVMAMVEQGLKVFGSITKRLFKALSSECRKLYRLNRQYLLEEEYFVVLDTPQAVFPDDYNEDDLDVTPVADPTMSSDMQRLMRTRGVLELSGRPGLNEVEVTRAAVQAIHPDGAVKLLKFDEQIAGEQPPPDALVMEVQRKIALDTINVRFETDKHALEMEKILAEIEKIRADTLLSIAKAEAEEVGPQMEQYKQELAVISADIKGRMDLAREMVRGMHQQKVAGMRGGGNGGSEGGPEGVSGMAESPGNAGGVPGIEGIEAVLGQRAGGGGNPPA